MFLAFACSKGFNVYQMDVKSTFLNGDLKEEVYMERPEGFDLVEGKDFVCKSKKALYGLKQAPRACNNNGTSHEFAQNMSKEFEMFMIGELSYFLGLQVTQTLFDMFISKAKYLRGMLKRYGMEECAIAVEMVVRFQSTPKESHFMAVKRILRYLKGTLDFGLWYAKSTTLTFTTYTDVDLAESVDD
eukprot:PITA_24670